MKNAEVKSSVKAYVGYLLVGGVTALHGYLNAHGLSVLSPQVDMILAPLIALLGGLSLHSATPPAK